MTDAPAMRLVWVSYDPENPRANNPNKRWKTLDPSLTIGDFVVVKTNTRHGYTVCRVDSVDLPGDPLDHPDWIIVKLDLP